MAERKSASGGTMSTLTDVVDTRPEVDLGVLSYRQPIDIDVVPAGQGPFLAPGSLVQWHWNVTSELAWVVRDDERGLVCWQPSGSERIKSVREDGRELRDVPVAERWGGGRVPVPDIWRGAGVLRVAPADRPWSVWFFRHEDGRFAGTYVNIELPHVRAADGSGHTFTRDCVLDLWMEPDGSLELKDADELESYIAGGRITPEQGEQIRRIADWARFEVLQPGAWPLDEGWQTWQPSAELDVPARFPA